ncbi:hypothetical protein RvY_18650 [Ramazzottius varieornatus]|uniref:Uncharacterized protein n=1 Tax=Ramazzottius varieornatus TaxID=947166 RepID=A0A1D1W6K7_RAMVA|nr:hypothetical protein RvY_18650 [Ramazzottius varieornatus]
MGAAQLKWTSIFVARRRNCITDTGAALGKLISAFKRIMPLKTNFFAWKMCSGTRLARTVLDPDFGDEIQDEGEDICAQTRNASRDVYSMKLEA